MASSDTKLQQTIPPVAPTNLPNETQRAKSIATRLTEAEFAEVESAATKAGKKVAEWLRDAALTQPRASQKLTDPILLAEIMGMRSLMLNLFARASEGPISVEELRKMSAHADSIRAKVTGIPDSKAVLIPVADLRKYARGDHPERIVV